MSETQSERGDLATRFSSERQPATRGRPRVYRERLTHAFLENLNADFEKHGPAVIEAVRTNEPAQYLKVVASLVPKEIELTRSLSGLDDDKLIAAIELVLAMRRPEDAKEIQADVLLND